MKNVGVDCVGLVFGALGINPDMQKYAGYSHKPNPRQVMSFMFDFFEPDKSDGYVALIEWREGVPMHLGILTTDNTIIHAYEPAGKVVEHRIPKHWILTKWRHLS